MSLKGYIFPKIRLLLDSFYNFGKKILLLINLNLHYIICLKIRQTYRVLYFVMMLLVSQSCGPKINTGHFFKNLGTPKDYYKSNLFFNIIRGFSFLKKSGVGNLVVLNIRKNVQNSLLHSIKEASYLNKSKKNIVDDSCIHHINLVNKFNLKRINSNLYNELFKESIYIRAYEQLKNNKLSSTLRYNQKVE